MALVQLQARRFELPHELMIVGGNQHRSAEAIKLNEKAE